MNIMGLKETLIGTVMAFSTVATAAPDVYLFEGDVGQRLDLSKKVTQFIVDNFEAGRGDCYGNVLYDSRGFQDQLDKFSDIDTLTIREIRLAIRDASLTETHPDGVQKTDTSGISVTEAMVDCENPSGQTYTTYSKGNSSISVEDSVPAAVNHTPNWVR